MTFPSAVSLRGVSRRFGDVSAMDGVDLEIAAGEFFAMLGPSGSGKTTCLRVIAGFERPDAGDVAIFGASVTDVPPYRRSVNTVFQDYALFPHLNVLDNVAYSLMLRKVGKPERRKQAEAALELVKLFGYGSRRPGQLSGGQRQRVALARALVGSPKVLLLDEPLGALDLKLRESMQEELKGLQKALGITFVLVTHDQGEALSMADRVGVFNQGRVVQVGSPSDIYQRPASRFVADFVGSSNVLPPALGERFSGERRWASLRPEAVRLDDDAGEPSAEGGTRAPAFSMTGTVLSRIYLGATTRLALACEGSRINAVLPSGSRLPAEGSKVRISFEREALHLMEGEA